MRPAVCAAIDYAITFDRVLPMIRDAGFQVISLGARPAHSAYDTPEGRRGIRQFELIPGDFVPFGRPGFIFYQAETQVQKIFHARFRLERFDRQKGLYGCPWLYIRAGQRAFL